MGGIESGTPVKVDVKDGKITRIRPLDYEWKYDKKDFNVWKIEARGSEFGPPLRSLPGPIMAAYKKRVYSKNRVRYPLKRVDWDPNGERNVQHRGKSKFVRISWDEAAQLVADELTRVQKKYGPEAVFAQADMHGEGKHIQASHGCPNRLLAIMGGYTVQMRNMDSWEGWAWGAKNVWGCEPMGEMTPVANLYPDIAKNADMMLFWGCDPETTPHPIQGMLASRLCYWLTEIGLSSIYVCPDLNYGAAVHADKWIPILPNTDAALHLAIAYMWITEGTYEKEYIANHAYGFDKFVEYVLGTKDGVPKTPKWASEKTDIPVWTIKALAREWAEKTASIIHGNGGPGIRGPFSTEPGRLEPMLLGMRGLGKPGVHQAKMIEWSFYPDYFPLPYSSKYRPRYPVLGEMVTPPEILGESHIPKTLTSHKRRGKEIDKYIPDHKRPPQQSIPKCMVHDAILNPPISWWGLHSFCGPTSEQFTEYTYPAPDCSEIHMILDGFPCWTTCWNDSNKYMDALRSEKIECIVAQQPLAGKRLPVCRYYSAGSDSF
jgi:trimethylamine-N-oxide reductase (cytochrome c)